VKASQIRQRFLGYFARNGHTVVPSSSLIPHDDPTLFFVNAGMVQFKDVFTGAERRDYARAVTAQKCLRVSGKHNDLENVGRTARHHTFFEMLGNFSFGDYFKADAIRMAWDLFIEDLGIDADRVWVTVYEDDDEAFALWRDRVGVPERRIQRLGAKDNFWSMGDTGPCGPCSELHYDFGAAISDDPRGPAGGDDRYVEFCNLVFMQFEQAADGSRTLLPRPSIDTGTGLERVATILQGVYNNYDNDLFQPLIQEACRISGATYHSDPEVDTALRVLADHARATAFLVADGVMPSNEQRGYVLRRVMRRAIRFGVKLGIDRPFLHELTRKVGEEFAGTYPDVNDRAAFVSEVVRAEEERFRRTLSRGMRLLDDALEAAGPSKTVAGDVAFTLSDTYGFPFDLTQLIAAEKGVEVDKAGFDEALEAQKKRGRQAWKGSGEQAIAEFWRALAETHGATVFTGYDHEQDTGAVLAIVKRGVAADGAAEWSHVDRLIAGETGVVLLDRTPFYGESGGQLGDQGTLGHEGGAATVGNTEVSQGLRLHHVTVDRGALCVGDGVHLVVDHERRSATRRNHTATHLLHAALRDVLGTHVAQKGSLVSAERLRFDFSHHKGMTADELRRIEDIVNREVLANHEVRTALKDIEAARADGAMALFGEKYDDLVRVVTVPGFSMELCGGTHCARTGDIGLFRLVSESGIAAGVRRIEGLTGTGALAAVRQIGDTLSAAAATLKAQPAALVSAIERLQNDKRAIEKELEALHRAQARAAAADLATGARTIGGVTVLIAKVDGDLREQADRLRDQLGSSVLVLASEADGKVQLLVAATKDVAGARFHAGKVIGELAPMVGGRGGGRPDLAQAGGADVAGLPAALERAEALVTAALGG
jgi:alanyl-tRNA synthetase